MTPLFASANTFAHQVQKQLTTAPTILLNLNPEQLTLFLAAWPPHSTPLAVLHNLSLPSINQLQQQLRAWAKQYHLSHHWHLINSSLSEPEQRGTISTRLTRSLHQLLSNPSNPHHHYFFPGSSLPFSLPSPAHYAAQTRQLVIGHNIGRLTDFGRLLVKLGYTRAQTAHEPGTYHLRGEDLEINHPTTGRHLLRFHHNLLEQIVVLSKPRRKLTTSYALLPFSFPSETVAWSELLESFALLRPGWLTTPHTGPTLIYDSLHPALTFPFSSLELKQKLTFSQPEEVATPNQINLLLRDLVVGRPAVHEDHGLGLYEGLQNRVINNTPQDYFVLRYADGDTLSVPVARAHKITPYLGHSHPVINRLSRPQEWQKTRRQATADAAAFAKALLATAGKRQRSQRTPYTLHSSLDHELSSSFPHTLTPDQEQVWQAVQHDLTGPLPMDRLVVGDVGFGKTEIALRAAAHVAANGSQVALIAPTTLLVQQHYDTFISRLPHFASQLGLLSRFTSSRARAQTRQQLATGQLKIIIGTHALLSSKLHWQNLGLVIIDEEQRFGVKQKEQLKNFRATVDVLSLSATPIPRTLSMALTGLRDLSVITTPPLGRKSVKTYIAEDSDSVLIQALRHEVARHGQAYVVSHHIRRLSLLKTRLQRLLPEARTGLAHGQMEDQALAAVMHQFDQGQLDILISSSIIENGLDLPRANTLLVCEATHFGLSDLYQLRGRVGRRDRQGYAYFLYEPTQPLTPLQRQRLTALTEASRLGSGWHLAERDLELRGAGNLLGAEQSGSVNAVGLQLYLDLVQNASEQTSASPTYRHEIEISLPLPALLPTTYVTQTSERAHHYQTLARARTPQALDQLLQKLIQRYGPLPPETQNLAALLHFKYVAAANNITHLQAETITPPGAPPYWHLTLTAKHLPPLLSRLPTWHIKNISLVKDYPNFTRADLQTLTRTLRVQ
jgi:transcription-repair coupling factor (superfamily II helicase)